MEKLNGNNIDDILILIDKSVLSPNYKKELNYKINLLHTAKITYPMDSPKGYGITYPFEATDKNGKSITVVGYSGTVGWIIKGSCKNNLDTHYFLKDIYME